MALSEELKAIVERILAGTETEEEITILQKACEGNEEITLQFGSYIVNIGGQAKEFQIYSASFFFYSLFMNICKQQASPVEVVIACWGSDLV